MGSQTVEKVLAPYHRTIDGYCNDESHVFFSIDQLNGNDYEYLALDRTDNSITTIKSSEKIYLRPKNVYEGRCWDIQKTGNGGWKICYLDMQTLQADSFPLDVSGFDIDEIEKDYNNGIFVLNGTLRSNGCKCVATVNLSTQKTEIVTSAPGNVSINLNPLN